MKNICINLFTFFFIWNLSAQSLITVEGAAGTFFYTSVPDAIEGANDGDVVYLPGGSFSLGAAVGGLNIYKQIQIIGAGYNVDSSQATQITTLDGSIYFADGSSGSSLMGVNVTGDITLGYSGFYVLSNVSEILLSRCKLSILILGYEGSTIENILVSECIFTSTDVNLISSPGALNILVSKCIFNGYIQGFNGLATFTNCLFLSNYPGIMLNVQNTTIKNCIFLKSSDNNISPYLSNLFYNNIFVFATPNITNDGSNFLGIPQANIFIDQGGYVYLPNDDYHLQNDCVGINSGNDGTDIGIYGTIEPFIDGGVPINPHIQFKSIGTSTNAEGDLPINIKVAAQDN